MDYFRVARKHSHAEELRVEIISDLIEVESRFSNTPTR